MLRVFIGYDKDEQVAYHVLAHSILRRSTIPVSICPLNRDNLRGFFSRERGEFDSTDFAISRFLVPFLCDYQGFAVFMDCDMLVHGDVAELANYMTLMDHYNTAIRVAKHDYTPKTQTKFLDQVQTKYEKKNWSSVILFNNTLCRKLTPEYVNKTHGLDLHQFKWLEDHQIGNLPLEWNWLVGEYARPEKPIKNYHYTLGTPCFPDCANSEYASLWWDEFIDMCKPVENNNDNGKDRSHHVYP